MQRYFKTLFVTLVPFALGFFVCYLIGSFVNLSFDTAMWTMDGRSITAYGGFAWGCALYLKLQFEGLV